MAIKREQSLEERARAILKEVAEFQREYFGSQGSYQGRRNRRKSRQGNPTPLSQVGGVSPWDFIVVGEDDR